MCKSHIYPHIYTSNPAYAYVDLHMCVQTLDMFMATYICVSIQWICLYAVPHVHIQPHTYTCRPAYVYTVPHIIYADTTYALCRHHTYCMQTHICICGHRIYMQTLHMYMQSRKYYEDTVDIHTVLHIQIQVLHEHM